MKTSALLRASCALFVGGVAVSSAQAEPENGKITFNFTGDTLDSITIDSAFAFVLDTDFGGTELQIRIFDVFPGTGGTTRTTGFTGFFLEKNGGDSIPLSNTNTNLSQFSGNLGGLPTDGDFVVNFGASSDTYDLVNGDLLVWAGSGVPANPSGVRIDVPTSGTYIAYLSGKVGSDRVQLAAPITVEIVGLASIPEPSSAAVLAGAFALAGVAMRRRRRA